jgi:hypothetical protein
LREFWFRVVDRQPGSDRNSRPSCTGLCSRRGNREPRSGILDICCAISPDQMSSAPTDRVALSVGCTIVRYWLFSSKLTAPQMAAVALAIISDPYLSSRVEMKLPRYFLREQSLPDEILTDQRATHFRHAETEKPIVLLANTGDDEEQSLKDVVPIGNSQLQDSPDLWVAVASDGLLITDDHRRWWQRALAGLQDLRILSLDRLAEYVLRTRQLIEQEGMTILQALGAALPALRIPRDSAYFNKLNDKTRNHASRWRSLYENAQKKRACYLLKQTPSQQQILEDDLQHTFETVREPAQAQGRFRCTLRLLLNWRTGRRRRRIRRPPTFCFPLYGIVESFLFGPIPYSGR